MRERIAQIHPGCIVHGVEEFVEPEQLAGAAAARRRRASSTPATRSGPRWRWPPGRCRRARLFISVGAAGGKRLAHKVDVDDLANTTHDPLLAQLR